MEDRERDHRMSEDLIRRSDAIKVAKEFWYKPDIAGALAELPTIKPKTKVVAQVTFDEEKLREIVKEAVERFKEEYEIEPKRGEWIVYEGGWKDLDYYPPKCKCNQCGYEEELYILNAKPTNFCSNCGAKMKGANDE